MNRIAQRVGRAIEDRVFPGCVIGVVRRDADPVIMSFGRLTYDSDSSKAQVDTIYDLASVTKSIPLASLVAGMIESGRVHESDLVRKYLPELRHDYSATIEDLLTYRVAGMRMSDLQHHTADEIPGEIMRRGFAGPPSPESSYSNLPAFLLGLIVECVAGDTLVRLATKQFFRPLHMRDTTFSPRDVLRVAPTEIVGGEELRAIVHDESARVFARAGKAVGHAGLFSTVPDLLTFLSALLEGEYPSIVERARRGLGWQTTGIFLGSHPRPGMFGKTGFTGTSVVCDIEGGRALAILSNCTYPHRPKDSSAINALRRAVADIVFI